MRTLKRYTKFVESLNESDMAKYNAMIDYTELDPTTNENQIASICEIAKQLQVATICVLPKMVPFAAKCLEGSDIGITTVISFPEGTNSLEEKIDETKSIAHLVTDVDMVLNYQFLKENWIENNGKITDNLPMKAYYQLVKEVTSLTKISHENGAILKVIVESGLLTEKQTEVATEICIEAGADFIKTSTGKVTIGAEPNKVAIMKNVIDRENSDMEIKASGGVRTMEDINTYESLGVTRFGMGYGSVDKLNGIKRNIVSEY